MLSVQLGDLIKKQRLARGLKQEELASAARVSRSIISHLEQSRARPVQTDILDRIFQALGIDPLTAAGAGADTAMEERRRVRIEHARKLDAQRLRHLKLAITLAADPASARRLVTQAQQRVELWKSEKTCSPYYIKRWSEMLALPPKRLALRMASLGEWENALLQNSPWSSAWT